MREYIYEIAPTMGSRTTLDRAIAAVTNVNTATPGFFLVLTDHLHRPVRMTNAAKATVWDVVWTLFVWRFRLSFVEPAGSALGLPAHHHRRADAERAFPRSTFAGQHAASRC